MEIDKNVIEEIGSLLKIASDPTRLKIMFSLLDTEKCHCGCAAHGDCAKCHCLSCMIEKRVGDITLEINESQSLVSHQLKTLKDADFVKSRKEGTTVYYSLKDGHIKEMLSLAIEHVMEGE